MTDIALVSCRVLPEPDVDEAPLLAALHARGLHAEVAAWDDPSFDWSKLRVAVVRSTWNYHRAPDEFVAWAEGVAARGCVLRNGPQVIRWNAHKGYLRELERAGVPVVPTSWVDAGDAGATLAAARAKLGVERVVVKPTVSAGSWNTIVVGAGDDQVAAERHLRTLVAERDVMVQPYLESVEGYGERSLVYVDGVLRHAIRKGARFAGQDESVSLEPVQIAAEEAELGDRVLAAVPRLDGGQPLLYARVDIARDGDGVPLLMELELIEPSLFLTQAPATLEAFADAIGHAAASST